MTTEGTQPLVKAKVRRWHDVRSGWLVIEPTKLMVYRRRFLRRPEKAGDFEMCGLRAADPDAATGGLSVTFEVPLGERACELFCFPDHHDLETVTSVLSGLLQTAQEEREREKREAARLEKEAEERRRQIREEFAADLWLTAETIWSLAMAVYTMENAVIAGDWNEARSQYSNVWQHADRLKTAQKLDLSVPLRDLDESIRTGNGEEAIRKAGPLLKALNGGVLNSEALWNEWRRPEVVASAVSPNWNHLPYFLLFAAARFEIMLSSRIEDWSGVSKGLSVLRSSSPILRECFKVELDGLLDAADSAGAERNANLIAETTGRNDDTLTSSFKNRPFEYKDQEPQPFGGHDASLSEST